MRYLCVLILCVLSLGCGSGVDDTRDAGIGEQSQAAATYMAWNGAVQLPNLANHLCHPTAMTGSGANSQSVILSGNVPECGGIGSISAQATAYPNSCVSPISAQQGSMFMTVRCQPLSDFGPVTLGSTEFLHSWSGTGSLSHVSSGVQMLPLVPAVGRYNACYLSGLGSMSVGNEYAWISYSGTHPWLNADGYRALSVSARCSRLGRAGGPVETIHAWPGTPGVSNMNVAAGVCLVTQVNGSIDDGGFTLSQGTKWSLSISGNVGYARAECYTYN